MWHLSKQGVSNGQCTERPCNVSVPVLNERQTDRLLPGSSTANLVLQSGCSTSILLDGGERLIDFSVKKLTCRSCLEQRTPCGTAACRRKTLLDSDHTTQRT